MNGFQFRAAQMEDPGLADVPVIITSAVATEPWAKLEGVAARFPKPFDMGALLTAIALHATGERVAARVTHPGSQGFGESCTDCSGSSPPRSH